MGVGTHFGQDKGYLEGNLDVMEQAGVTSLRDEIHWAEVEREKGVLEVPPSRDEYVRRAAARGIEPLLILDYANPFYDGYRRPTSREGIEGFTRYAEFMAEHFKGVVKSFEVWNEYDIPIGGGNIQGSGDPAAYVRMLKPVYARLKEIDPRITVVAGGMTNAGMYNGFLDGLLENGVLEYCDVLSVHPYNFGQMPLQKRRPEAWWGEMQYYLRPKLRRYNRGEDFPVYVTEMGWPTQINDTGVTQELAAAYCARLYLLAGTLPFLRGIWWYDFQDDFWSFDDREGNFGLVRPDLTPKEAYHAYAAVSDLVAAGAYERRLDTPDPDIWAVLYAAPRGAARRFGRDVLAVWSAHLDDDWSVVLRSRRPKPVALEQVGRPALDRDWGRREWYDDRGAPVIPNELEVTLRRMPVLVRGDLDSVSVTRVTRRDFPEMTR
jgi:hypothetical protein